MIHHDQSIVGIEGYFRQPQGVVGGEALQLDSRSLMLAAQQIQQKLWLFQWGVEQQGDLPHDGTVLVMKRDTDIGVGLEGQQPGRLGVTQCQIFHIDGLTLLEQLQSGALL